MLRVQTPLARLAPVGAALLLAAARAGAQPAPRITGSAALKAQAKIGPDSATAIARAQVPHGQVQSGEIEREKGRLIYSFDIEVPGKAGIEEINVDARTGAVVGREHESPAAERKEAAQERKTKGAKKPMGA